MWSYVSQTGPGYRRFDGQPGHNKWMLSEPRAGGQGDSGGAGTSHGSLKGGGDVPAWRRPSPGLVAAEPRPGRTERRAGVIPRPLAWLAAVASRMRAGHPTYSSAAVHDSGYVTRSVAAPRSLPDCREPSPERMRIGRRRRDRELSQRGCDNGMSLHPLLVSKALPDVGRRPAEVRRRSPAVTPPSTRSHLSSCRVFSYHSF